MSQKEYYRNIRGEGYRSLAEVQGVEFALQKGAQGLPAYTQFEVPV